LHILCFFIMGGPGGFIPPAGALRGRRPRVGGSGRPEGAGAQGAWPPPIKYPFFVIGKTELFIIMVEGFRGIRVPFNEAGMGKSRRRYPRASPPPPAKISKDFIRLCYTIQAALSMNP
jgi:hypothetical protein